MLLLVAFSAPSLADTPFGARRDVSRAAVLAGATALAGPAFARRANAYGFAGGARPTKAATGSVSLSDLLDEKVAEQEQERSKPATSASKGAAKPAEKPKATSSSSKKGSPDRR